MPPPFPLAELPLNVQLLTCRSTGAVVDAPARVVRGVVAKRAVPHSQRCPAPNESRIIMDSAGAASLLAGRVTGQCGITHDRPLRFHQGHS